ncbi:MAG: DNA-binding transcriptional regulator YbjK [Crocinitomicaceae bacterium]|jgi:DNA-binding transcriptional regulator YbjK
MQSLCDIISKKVNDTMIKKVQIKNTSKRAPAKKKASPGIYPAGKATKRTLLIATLRIIAKKGMWAVTHRAVAAEAGAALRTTTYYFATKQDLIKQAFRYFNEQELQRLDELNSRLGAVESLTLEESADAIAALVEAELNDPNQIVVAEFELILAIAREHSYAPEYDEVQRVLQERSLRRMKSLGVRNPEQLGRMSLALLRGYQLLSLAQPDSPFDAKGFRDDMLLLVRSNIE